MNGEKLYIIIPAFNEAENIKSVIDDWYPIIEEHNKDGSSRLVIINDGSNDDTFDIIKECAETKPLLIPLTKSNQGHGPTVIYGYKYAIAQKADYIFQTDSDGQTNPEEFETFWNLRNEYDIVLGNRRDRGDGAARAFVEDVVCFLIRIYFGVKVPDANAPFRLMKAQVLDKYINRLPNDYNLPNIILTAYFVHYKEKVIFQEISFKPRQGGINTINIKRIVKIGWKALGDFRMFRKDMKSDDTKG